MFNAKEYYKRLENYVALIRQKTDFIPDIAIILGSGLGNFADNIDVKEEIDYHELPGFPVSTVPGHAGKFIMGYIGDKKVICMKGRVHYYEGYEPEEVVVPIRVMRMLGAQTVIITNAVGCMNTDFSVGSFMVSKDCITTFIPSPLRGPNIDELGPRFVDVSEIYDKSLRKKILDIGSKLGIEVHEGVFVQLSGPQFETATEIRMLKNFGADCCGMSSAIEAIAARHMDMKIAGISCITNYGTGISERKLSMEEVLEVGNMVSDRFEKLIINLIEEM